MKFKLYNDYKCLKLINFFSFSDFLFIRYGQVNIEEYVNHVEANSYIAYYMMEYLCGKCLMYPAGLQQSVLTPHWMGITYFLYPQERPRGWI